MGMEALPEWKVETKETFNRLKEHGKVHMHSPRMVMHRRTMILHGLSIEMYIAATFCKLFPKEEDSSPKNILYFLFLLMLMGEGGFP